MKRLVILSIAIMVSGVVAWAQGSYEEYLRATRQEYSQYKNDKKREFEEFRARANADYTRLMREQWAEFRGEEAVPAPAKEVAPPVVPTTAPVEERTIPAEDKPVAVDNVVKMAPVAPEKKLQPVVRIDDAEVSADSRPDYRKGPYEFTFYGTTCGVRLANNLSFSLTAVDENAIADEWARLCANKGYADLVKDCLSLAREMSLCDWAYLQMVETISGAFCGRETNEAVLLQSFVLNQSGYKIRIARTPQNKLCLLVASNYMIYDKKYFVLDGERFYLLQSFAGNRLKIFNSKFPNDCAIDMSIADVPKLARKMVNKRTLVSQQYPDLSVSVAINRNLMDFYNSYPTSSRQQDENTKWNIYARVPLSYESRAQLYPALRQAIAGKSEAEAANILLNFVQTAFKYEYDDKVWGRDRIFTADETLYYPYSDCEDRSILYSRLVQDLLGLDVVLIYYPGHLATAVSFNEPVTGDYLRINGRRYLVCDPTYIGASIGRTMTGLDNTKVQVIVL
ncbi:MAG: hypothetical protein IJY36_02405 [Coprobacter sp.]|nr:hypothetical protein [Coprobacter sp.]